jgi:5-methylcytosine-specific restriction endonuclease McrA
MALKPCLDCGCRTNDSRCAACQARIGRNTYHWQQTRAARKELDGHRCVYCGSTDDLTGDLLRGHHSTATLRRLRHRMPALQFIAWLSRAVEQRSEAWRR